MDEASIIKVFYEALRISWLIYKLTEKKKQKNRNTDKWPNNAPTAKLIIKGYFRGLISRISCSLVVLKTSALIVTTRSYGVCSSKVNENSKGSLRLIYSSFVSPDNNACYKFKFWKNCFQKQRRRVTGEKKLWPLQLNTKCPPPLKKTGKEKKSTKTHLGLLHYLVLHNCSHCVCEGT